MVSACEIGYQDSEAARRNEQPGGPYEIFRPCGTSGSERSRTPVASKDGIRDRRRQTDHRALSRSRRRKVLAVEQHRLDGGKVAEARNAILQTSCH